VGEVNAEGYDYPAVEDVIEVSVAPLTDVFDVDDYDTNGTPGIQFDEVLQAIQEANTDEDTTPAPDDTSFDDVLRLIEAFNTN
jgi:hypothetical protein